MFQALLCFVSIFQFSTQVSLNDLDLIMVHSVWRHGDRSPESRKNNDPVREDEWITGGGGLGQLTANGMEQQFMLGKLLRDRYIQTTFPGFLSQYYESKQVFIRSTDVNRTISSAMANMLGMFPVGRPGIDYPNITGWPEGFVPVPVHSSVPSPSDNVLNSEFKCPRRYELLDIAHSGEEFQNYLKDKKYLEVTDKLSRIFGYNVTYANMYLVTDTINTELTHFPDRIKSVEWFTQEFYEDVEAIERKNKGYHAGLYTPPIVDGINVKKEIQKLKGGSLVNEISGRMRTKVNCNVNPNKCTTGNIDLKYYAYSTHDHTLMSFLTIFDIEDIVAGREKYGEWPDFASCVTIELFANKEKKQPYFRMLYHRNANSTFETVTHRIKGCKSEEFCDFKVFENRAKEYRLDEPIEQACKNKKKPVEPIDVLRLASQGAQVSLNDFNSARSDESWLTVSLFLTLYFIQNMRS